MRASQFSEILGRRQVFPCHTNVVFREHADLSFLPILLNKAIRSLSSEESGFRLLITHKRCFLSWMYFRHAKLAGTASMLVWKGKGRVACVHTTKYGVAHSQWKFCTRLEGMKCVQIFQTYVYTGILYYTTKLHCCVFACGPTSPWYEIISELDKIIITHMWVISLFLKQLYLTCKLILLLCDLSIVPLAKQVGCNYYIYETYYIWLLWTGT